MTLDLRETAAPPASGGMPDTSGLNFYEEDRNLRFVLDTRLPADDRALAEPVLREAGEVAGGELDRLARDAEKNPPRLVQYDARGERVDEIVYHPSYHAMERIAFERFKLAAISHRPGLLGWTGTVPHAVKYALSYVLIQSEFGLFCPVNMTDSAARVLRRFAEPELRDRFVPRLTATRMEDLLQGAQFMTEKAGGSDVGAAETEAVPWGPGAEPRSEGVGEPHGFPNSNDGAWRLHGDKWFCSNASADLMLTLARPRGAGPGTRGLGLFLVPKRLEDGARNRYRINRLKDKLGTRDMASGEITLDGAFAYQVGPLDRGFVQMMEMVSSSRLSNAMRAAALTRRGLLEATVHATGRVAFGRTLDQHPLMRETLLELTLDSESATAAVVHTGTVYDAADRGSEPDARLLRILTPLIKMAICKRARWSTGESMEVRGGNGYIEDWVDPRLLRDAHLGSIWEGATSVLALDVLRAVTRDAAHEALIADIEDRLRSVRDAEVRRAASLLLPLASRLRTSVEAVATLPDDERELPMLELCDRLYLLYAASLLVEEAGVQATAGSHRKLVIAAEFIRRRLLRLPEGWTGPRPGSGTWFRAVIDWQPVPPGAATALLDHLAATMPVALAV